MLSPQLKSKIRSLWDAFWSGGVANPLSAIEQITYLVFLKRLEDLDTERAKNARAAKQKYKSIFDFKANEIKKLKDGEEYRWSYIKRLPTEERFTHVRNYVFDWMKSIEGATPEDQERMRDAVFLIPNAALLERAVHILDDLFVPERNHDTLGDIYEDLLNEIATAGKNGQFRTPRHIIKLMAELVAPQLGQRIADPACGTGGFLLGAYQYILTDLVRGSTSLSTSDKKIQKDEDGFERAAISAVLTQEVKDILDKSFTGYDIDTTMVRLGLMNLMMHGIDEPQIDYKDTLSNSYNEDSRFDIVMANPPFTGNIDKGDINESLKLPTTKTELLFVERIFNILKMGGTAAVIVPSGVIQNSGKAFEALRKMLIEKTELKAVIAMPSGVFKPYAGVSTAILIFTKGGETNHVWFYDMQADGYTLDDKRNKIAESDLPDIVQRYKERVTLSAVEGDRKQKYFTVPKKEIVENKYDLNLSTYKEEVY